MRIAHVLAAPFGAASANGVSEMVRDLACAQVAAGDRVAVFSSVDGGHILGASDDPGRRPPGVLPGRGMPLAERLIAKHLNRPLVDDVLAWQPDVVHFHSVHVPHHVMMAVRLCRDGIPYGVTVHGGLFPAALRRGHLKKAAFNLLFERQFLNSARFIHALSSDEADAIRRYGVACTIPIVPNGIPTDAGLEPSRPDALYRAHPHLRHRRIFMFIGRLDPCHKGVDLSIAGFARAAPDGAALVLVGPDFRGSRRRLEQLSQRLGIPDHVIFTGPAFGEDRANLLAAADVFIHPSRWEGLSLSVLTAAAAGKPCLITRCADPLSSLERAGAAIVVESTVAGVAAGVRGFSTLGARDLEIMGARAKQVSLTYPRWSEVADRLLQTYRRALGIDGADLAQCNPPCLSSR
jgi:glycosyltransferase involved in cell wall biosynthesis